MKRLLLLAPLLACAPSTTNAPPGEPPLEDATQSLVPAVDDDPADDVFALRLNAGETNKRYGQSPTTPVWAYNGSVPGPVVEARVGQRFVVEYTNNLPEASTVHWHGIRLPATMDGTLAMQNPVQPGGSFHYEFPFKDAGLYWFHPHMRSDIQIQKGLQGVIVVRGENEPASDQEILLVLDDIRLNADGTIREYLDDNALMMGREGNTLLVNGVANASLNLRRGGTIRMRILNTANGRFFNLHLPGLRFRVIGTDGGLIPNPYDTEKLLIAPAERYDVMVTLPSTGDALDLINEPYERGHHSGSAETMRVARVFLTGDAPATPAPLPSTGPALTRIAEQPVDDVIVLDETTRDGQLVFTVNGATFPDVPMIMAPLNAAHVFELKNESDMDHPFHLHGFFFQVLSRNDVAEPMDKLANKDTIILPGETTMKIVAFFDEPGMWMYHCHINEHSEGGMMGELHVE